MIRAKNRPLLLTALTRSPGLASPIGRGPARLARGEGSEENTPGYHRLRGFGHNPVRHPIYFIAKLAPINYERGWLLQGYAGKSVLSTRGAPCWRPRTSQARRRTAGEQIVALDPDGSKPPRLQPEELTMAARPNLELRAAA